MSVIMCDNDITSPPPFTLENLENAFQWVCTLRKEYSSNSDIWRLRRDWDHIKHKMLLQFNDGSYPFGLLDRYEFEDAIISLWSSQDMIALKLITQVLGQRMAGHIPESCYHIKGHGGLKKAVADTYAALADHQFIFRSDVKSFYESTQFDVLMGIIETYVNNSVLLNLTRKALRRTETRGGLFYTYEEKGLPMGSPLSPLLGAIALIPLDKAMGRIKGIFYARFMDDWLVLTKSKTALRKIIKITHDVMNTLKFQLHPTKTFIGKIKKGFNFLGYYMDFETILPATETIRRAFERTAALYETSQKRNISRRYKRMTSDRDISEYQTNEPAPTDAYFQNTLNHLLSLAAYKPDVVARMRRYLGQWACWLKLGLSTNNVFETCVQTQLPGIYLCWTPGATL
jgi:RNA-directed DNA polymerase